MMSVNFLPNIPPQLKSKEKGTYASVRVDEHLFIAKGTGTNTVITSKSNKLMLPWSEKNFGGCTFRRLVVLALKLVENGPCVIWIRLDLAYKFVYSYNFHYANKFYCVSRSRELYVVDPSVPVLSTQLLEMDNSKLLPHMRGDLRFQELNGEILALADRYNPNPKMDGFCWLRDGRTRKGEPWKIVKLTRLGVWGHRS
ncbi:uncharacterized protein A4U43_C09F6270 [Asparagus officinalis]|uniref:Uncharacterized protein n=1 Tax=Asparagus officinalis TaxID=4686 RepID=A0A5P1E913_ASPOF|nr:uncharacterized protein A4U43_C09F6270 [Asparagus officinalis]